MGQADPILTRLGAGPAVKKLVETALALASSSDPQQRTHAYSFMESAIRELEDGTGNQADPGLGPIVNDGLDDKKISEKEDDDDDKLHEEEGKHDAVSKVYEQEKDNDDHKINEEVLDNHNNGPREDGSEQSTDNTEPYSGQGIDTTNGEKPMQDMSDTVNQWNETGGMIMPGLPPDQYAQPGMGQPGMGAPPGMGPAGIAPDVARELGQNLPPPPDLNTNQMMRQIQYTVNTAVKNYHNKAIAPLNARLNTLSSTLKNQRETIINQRNAIKQLSMEIRETKTASGTMKLDLDAMRDNATAKFRETTADPSIGMHGYSTPDTQISSVQPQPNIQRNKVAAARSEIETMDRMLNSQKNPMYR